MTPAEWPEFSLLEEITALPQGAGFRMWQRKSDGFRCYATRDRLMLRGGRLVRHGLSIDIPDGWLLDGELVVPCGDVGDVSTALGHKRWGRLRFEAFDVLTADHEDVRPQPYRKRWTLLTERWPADVVEVLAYPGDEGPLEVPAEWEGVVGKLMESPWAAGRSTNAVKWKRSGVLTAIIAGFQPGRGTLAHTVGAVRFGLEDAAGKLVEVGVAGGLKGSDRSRFSAQPERYIGQPCLIKHYGMNKHKLRNPIFIGLTATTKEEQ